MTLTNINSKPNYFNGRTIKNIAIEVSAVY